MNLSVGPWSDSCSGRCCLSQNSSADGSGDNGNGRRVGGVCHPLVVVLVVDSRFLVVELVVACSILVVYSILVVVPLMVELVVVRSILVVQERGLGGEHLPYMV
jgi:hypothetical protein